MEQEERKGREGIQRCFFPLFPIFLFQIPALGGGSAAQGASWVSFRAFRVFRGPHGLNPSKMSKCLLAARRSASVARVQ
jgi:hypothetical protein